MASLPREEADLKFPLPKEGRKLHDTFANTESMIAFRARIELFLSKLKEDYPEDSKICIVSHGGMITMLLRALMNLFISTPISFGFLDISIHKVSVTKTN